MANAGWVLSRVLQSPEGVNTGDRWGCEAVWPCGQKGRKEEVEVMDRRWPEREETAESLYVTGGGCTNQSGMQWQNCRHRLIELAQRGRWWHDCIMSQHIHKSSLCTHNCMDVKITSTLAANRMGAFWMVCS